MRSSAVVVDEEAEGLHGRALNVAGNGHRIQVPLRHIFHLRSPAPQSDRDYLISHPDPAQRYGEVKKVAVLANPDSRGGYGQTSLQKAGARFELQ